MEKRSEKGGRAGKVEYRNGRLYIGFEGGAKKFGARLLPFSMRNVMLYKYEK